MQAVIFSLELVKTFFNMSEPVWVYDVTFLALFGGWEGCTVPQMIPNGK